MFLFFGDALQLILIFRWYPPAPPRKKRKRKKDVLHPLVILFPGKALRYKQSLVTYHNLEILTCDHLKVIKIQYGLSHCYHINMFGKVHQNGKG